MNDARKAATTVASQVWARCEVRFQSWPYRLLAWPMLDKAGRDQLQEVFWNADACCLDSWFSSPLRSAMTSADQFGNPEFISLLETLVQRVRTTNMALEGFLNEIKNSAPAGRGQKPSMERLSYLGFLKTLMKQHLKAGHRDSRMCMGRDELAARGVPVEGKARVVYKARRPDMKWRVGMFDQWSPRWRSDVVPGALQTKSAELAERWRGMSDQERAPWLDQEASEGEDSEVDDSAANDFFKGMGLEFPGDSNWPVRSEVLSSFLEGEVAESNVCAGVANKMARIRFAAQDKLFIKDAGLVPDGKTFLHRLSCSERHPGLCFVSDHWLYQDCLMMVKSLETCLTSAALHRYIMIAGFGEDLLLKYDSHRHLKLAWCWNHRRRWRRPIPYPVCPEGGRTSPKPRPGKCWFRLVGHCSSHSSNGHGQDMRTSFCVSSLPVCVSLRRIRTKARSSVCTCSWHIGELVASPHRSRTL